MGVGTSALRGYFIGLPVIFKYNIKRQINMSFDGTCPYCGAKMIWQSDFEHVNDKIFSDFYCPECETELLCPCEVECEVESDKDYEIGV